MSLADYLAKNYLTADTAPPSKKKSNNSNSKKRKRKGATEIATATSGLIIADDNDDDDILHASTARDGAGDDYGPVTCIQPPSHHYQTRLIFVLMMIFM